MKFLSFALVFAAVLVSANPTLEKRAGVNDVANIGYAQLAGTSGGSGASVTTVTTLSALKTAVTGDAKKVVRISGTISGNEVVKVGANTTIVGCNASLVGVGLRVVNVNNVIIRGVKISKVLADAGDAIGVQNANKIWLDHLDLSSDRDHDKVRLVLYARAAMH
ncbi:hypothetical protein HGRIS_004826 [Hohenbuehelia grisea]|uniref:Pectate lyase domain-containing protein n=1 Tax=Hohenbuehelia grisea TaxID=104357 RepID=A0ABR3JDA9_9AGAR